MPDLLVSYPDAAFFDAERLINIKFYIRVLGCISVPASFSRKGSWQHFRWWETCEKWSLHHDDVCFSTRSTWYRIALAAVFQNRTNRSLKPRYAVKMICSTGRWRGRIGGLISKSYCEKREYNHSLIAHKPERNVIFLHVKHQVWQNDYYQERSMIL